MQNNIWGDVLSTLEKQINRPSFNTWIRPTRLVSLEHQRACIGVPDDVFVYWLGEHYVNVIVEVMAEIVGFQPEVSFVVMDAVAESGVVSVKENIEPYYVPTFPQTESLSPPPPAVRKNAPLLGNAVAPDGLAKAAEGNVRQMMDELFLKIRREAVAPQPAEQAGRTAFASVATVAQPTFAPAAPPEPVAARMMQPKPAHAPGVSSLNAGYTFQSYVAGSNNRFAHAASLAVAEQLAVNYNPLFIYGGVGLGKTHLLHAIGNKLIGLRPHLRVLYLSAEQFMNELVASIREDRMNWFREKYRSIDLLLVDDIQFIARKERTQEEFFHTFNTLYQAHKQIVLTSDCPPKKIPTIAEQLRSRFEWGLIADIQPPDLETRVAILKKKAEIQQVVLPDDVAIYIANRVKSNIRELEGSLSKIRAYSTFNRQPISLALAQKVLQDMFDAPVMRKITIAMVQQVVASHYQLEPTVLTSAARTRNVSLPRQIAMYLSRELTHLSLPDIGRNFGGRDHTTVMHACKKMEETQAKDSRLREHISQIRNLIEA